MSVKTKALIEVVPRVIYAKSDKLSPAEYSKYVDLVADEDFVYYRTPKYRVLLRYRLEKRATLPQIINAFVNTGKYSFMRVRNDVFQYYRTIEMNRKMGLI